MPRRPRLAIAGIPWHIIQRGNNRTVCYYAEKDYLRTDLPGHMQGEFAGCQQQAL